MVEPRNAARLRRRALVLSSALAVPLALACSPDQRPTEPQPTARNARFRASAWIIDVDTRAGTMRVKAPSASEGVGVSAARVSASAGDERPAFSLVSGDGVTLTTSRFSTTPLQDRILVRFSVGLGNRLGNTELVTPTWPAPPAGVQGVLLVPLAVSTPNGAAIANVIETADWNGTGAPGSGMPHNFFNDDGCPTGSNDCLRWVAFAAPLAPGASTAGRTVGFSLPKSVTQFQVALLVAADLRDLPATGTISGTVTSPEIGPLAGVGVSAAGLSATTDASGGFGMALAPLGAAAVSLTALPPGCANPGTRQVTVAATQISTAHFSVHCSGTVTGTVRSGSVGVGGVIVVVGTQSTTTTGQGTFAFSGVPAGVQQLSVSAPSLPNGCATPAPQSLTIASGGAAAATVLLDCVGSLEVHVQDDLGNPLAGASIRLSAGAAPLGTGTSDGLGNASFASVPSGAITLSVQRPGSPPLCNAASATSQISVGVKSLATVSLVCHGGLDILLVEAGTHRRIEGADVDLESTFYRARGVTDAAGIARFSGVPGQSTLYGVSAVAAGCLSTAPWQIRADAGRVWASQFALQCWGRVTGRVDSPLGGSLGGVTVTAGGRSTTTASDGSYLLADVSTGVTSVALSNLPAHCLAVGPASVDVQRAQAVAANFAPTCSAATMNGVVRFTSGQGAPQIPAPNVQVTLVSASGVVYRTTSGFTGSYSFAGVRGGSYLVLFSQLPLGTCVSPAPISVTLQGTAPPPLITILTC